MVEGGSGRAKVRLGGSLELELWSRSGGPGDRVAIGCSRLWEATKKSEKTYMAPRIMMTAAPKLVTRTPHRSMDGTTRDVATANIMFLTPLVHRKCRNRE